MIYLAGIMLAVTIVLITLYIILNIEYANGVGSRFRYTRTLESFITNKYNNGYRNFDYYLIKLMGIRKSPNKDERKTGNIMIGAALIAIVTTIILQADTIIIFTALAMIVMGVIYPYVNAKSNQKKFDEELDKEVAEMFEVFNFYLSSGKSIEEALALTSDNIGDNLSPYMKKMVNNILLQSKDDAIDKLTEELHFNQNIIIFSSALKQAIKGYSDTLTSFVQMQSKLYVQLKNEQIERIIMQMPTKFSMVSALLIIATIVFLVVPVFTNVFSGLDIFMDM